MYEWYIVIGVPYDTALWQVGDSPEQNALLNMVSFKAKRLIFETKEKLVNYALDWSSAKVDSNKKAILEQASGNFKNTFDLY